MQNNLDKERTW